MGPMYVQRKVCVCQRKVIRGYKRRVQEIAGVKNNRILVENMDKTNLPSLSSSFLA